MHDIQWDYKLVNFEGEECNVHDTMEAPHPAMGKENLKLH